MVQILVSTIFCLVLGFVVFWPDEDLWRSVPAFSLTFSAVQAISQKWLARGKTSHGLWAHVVYLASVALGILAALSVSKFIFPLPGADVFLILLFVALTRLLLIVWATTWWKHDDGDW